MVKLSLSIALISSLVALAAPLAMPAQDSPKPVATINGQPISEEELMSAVGPTLLELQNQEYTAKSHALDKLVRERLVEAEAKRRGLTAAELLEQEVDSKIPAPSDDEAKAYYLAGRNQTAQSFDQVKSQMKGLLRAAEIQQAREEYAESLRAKAGVVILLSPPREEVAYDPARVRGTMSAPVTIVEFSDFQCPFCRKAATTMKNLLAEYNGRVKLAFRDFPLRALHPHAEMAAEAGRCAEEQGKFWEFHDAVFAADPPKLDEAGLSAIAQRIGLDRNSFSSCLASGKFKAEIDRDIQDGTRAGVSGTPGFFVNGVFLNGARPQSEFEKMIDRELGKRDRTETSHLTAAASLKKGSK